jgi:rare lipoprotein A
MYRSKIINSLLFKLMLSLLLVSSCSTVNDATLPDSGNKARKVKIAHPSPTSTRTAPKPAPVVNPSPRQVTASVSSQGYTAQGQATWYGVSTHGQKTASGEVYDLYGITAAHATLPLMSYVKVTNIRTGRSIIVKINDRLSPSASALILLSYSAAQRLELLGQSTTLVQIQGLPPQPSPSFP